MDQYKKLSLSEWTPSLVLMQATCWFIFSWQPGSPLHLLSSGDHYQHCSVGEKVKNFRSEPFYWLLGGAFPFRWTISWCSDIEQHELPVAGTYYQLRLLLPDKQGPWPVGGRQTYALNTVEEYHQDNFSPVCWILWWGWTVFLGCWKLLWNFTIRFNWE